MAPIQTYDTSFANQVSTLNMAPRFCHCGGLTKDLGGFWLPISRRGHFFNDSFFENVHSYFDSAVREILSKWVEKGVFSDALDFSDSTPNSFSLYRQLRSRNNQDENATTILSDNHTHKVVIDVQDFLEGDIKVKILGEKDVVVECQGSASSGEGSFTSSRKILSKKFTFPTDVNMAEVTSVISSDGVLTIEAPKLEIMSLQRAESVESCAASTCDSISSRSSSVSDKSDRVYYCKGCNKKIGGTWHTASETKIAQQDGIKVPIKIDASMKDGRQASPVLEETSSGFNGETRKINTRKIEDINRESVNRGNLSKNISQQGVKTNDNEAKTKYQSQIQTNCYDVPVAASYNFLPVSVRGPFFSDSFFRDLQEDFQSAVQQVLNRQGMRASRLLEDDLSAYRRLRCTNLEEETQAVKMSEDESNHKFVLDVQDFINGGEVTVKVVNDREIVVEGYTEREEGGSKSLKRFLKRFSVPQNVRMDTVSSVMSSDGVLTINAPKKLSVQPKEVIIPVSLEGNEKGRTTHMPLLSSDCLDSGNISSSQYTFCANNASSTNNSEWKSQIRPANEHIIPINIEGSSSDTETNNAQREVHVQRESRDVHVERNTQHLPNKRLSREYIIPIDVEGSSNIKSEATDDQRSVSVQNQGNQQNIYGEQARRSRASIDRIIPITIEGSYDSDKESVGHQQGHKHQSTGNRIIPVVVEGNFSHDITNTSGHRTKTESEIYGSQLCQTKIHVDGSRGTTNHQITNTNEAEFTKGLMENTDNSFKRSEKFNFSHPRDQSSCHDKDNAVSSQFFNDVASSSTKKYLPISRRGNFLEDTFFKDYHNDFQAAVKDVLIRCRQCTDVADYMTAYRNLRQKELRVENQALYAQEDQESFKIAVDAKDFVNGDITVYVDGEELVIEGKAENSEVKTSNSLTFSHRFLLPESFNISNIASAISSDGILTVKCPKKTDVGAGVRRMSTEARSKQESHIEGGHKLEEKRVKESSEKGKGYSSRTYSSSYSSYQQQSSKF